MGIPISWLDSTNLPQRHALQPGAIGNCSFLPLGPMAERLPPVDVTQGNALCPASFMDEVSISRERSAMGRVVFLGFLLSGGISWGGFFLIFPWHRILAMVVVPPQEKWPIIVYVGMLPFMKHYFRSCTNITYVSLNICLQCYKKLMYSHSTC